MNKYYTVVGKKNNVILVKFEKESKAEAIKYAKKLGYDLRKVIITGKRFRDHKPLGSQYFER